jgi:hypothetical protein
MHRVNKKDAWNRKVPKSSRPHRWAGDFRSPCQRTRRRKSTGKDSWDRQNKEVQTQQSDQTFLSDTLDKNTQDNALLPGNVGLFDWPEAVEERQQHAQLRPHQLPVVCVRPEHVLVTAVTNPTAHASILSSVVVLGCRMGLASLRLASD